jgi:hypothetical protein
MHPVARGLLAGTAGTMALNLSTYADMLVRGRGSSDTPAEVADRLAERAGIDLGAQEKKSSREQAAGALLGYATGLGVAAAYGMVSGRRAAPPIWLVGPLNWPFRAEHVPVPRPGKARGGRLPGGRLPGGARRR